MFHVEHFELTFCGIISPFTVQKINKLSPLISGAAIAPHIKRAWTVVLSTLGMLCRAYLTGAEVCCAIFCFAAAIFARPVLVLMNCI